MCYARKRAFEKRLEGVVPLRERMPVPKLRVLVTHNASAQQVCVYTQ